MVDLEMCEVPAGANQQGQIAVECLGAVAVVVVMVWAAITVTRVLVDEPQKVVAELCLVSFGLVLIAGAYCVYC